MKSCPTEKIAQIAQRNNLNPATLANDIVNALRDAGMFYDEEDVLGEKIKDSIDNDVTAQDFCKVIKNVMQVENLRGDEYFAALELVVMGDYDCPECGCELEVEEEETRIIGGNGYSEEYEYETIYEVKRCPHCGHIIKKQYV